MSPSNRKSLRIEGYPRMFPGLPALEIGRRRLTALADEMVRPSRVPEFSRLPAGYTYFGQLIAHDLTRIQGLHNLRERRLRLDSLYGHPVGNWRHLYTQNRAGDRIFLISRGASPRGVPSREMDLPRNEDGSASIPDERDDFHFIISQLHLAFMLLHNRMTLELRSEFPRKSSAEIFNAVRRKLCGFYRWIIVNDFLPRLCDEPMLSRLRAMPGGLIRAAEKLSPKHDGTVFLEFALAGYRFGHGLVRPGYKLNDSLWTGPIFRPLGETQWYGDWRGHRKLPIQWSVQWDLFFDFGNSEPQRACRIGTSIASGFAKLPNFTVADDPERVKLVNLAERTLRAGAEAGLPSGQDVARYVLGKIWPKMDLLPFRVVAPGEQDPLWCYVLKEASELAGGLRLGPVGSWIVVATIMSLLFADRFAQVHQPSLPMDLSIQGGAFQLRDLIRYSGLPVTYKDWTRYVDGHTPTWC